MVEGFDVCHKTAEYEFLRYMRNRWVIRGILKEVSDYLGILTVDELLHDDGVKCERSPGFAAAAGILCLV